MIITIFSADLWDAVRPHLQNTAYPSMQLLAFVPLMNLFSLYIQKFAEQYGNDDSKMVSGFQLNSVIIAKRYQQMEGEALMDGIGQYTETQKKFFGINLKEYQGDVQKLSELRNSISELEQEPEQLNLSSRVLINRSVSWLPNLSRSKGYLEEKLLSKDNPSLQSLS